MRKRICLILTLLFVVHLVSCSKEDAYSAYAPPVDGVQWGMSPDEVLKVLKLSEDMILVEDERLTVIEYSNAIIHGQTATVNMKFDTQADIGLLGMDVFFADMDKEDLIDKLNSAYGAYTAVDDNMTPYRWESEKIKELPQKIQDRFSYVNVEFPIQVGAYEESSYDSAWDMIQNEPLVRINIVGDDTISYLSYTAENMAAYVLFNDDKAYEELQEYLQDSPNLK